MKTLEMLGVLIPNRRMSGSFGFVGFPNAAGDVMKLPNKGKP